MKGAANPQTQVSAWIVRRNGMLYAWSCFAPGPEYALASYSQISLIEARRRIADGLAAGLEILPCTITLDAQPKPIARRKGGE